MKFEGLQSDTQFLEIVMENMVKVEREQIDNMMKAADMMADAIAQDKLIHV